jgi:Protein of unknown function (DUF2752)
VTAVPAAPATTADRWRRVRPPVALAAGLLAACVLLHLRDPHRSGSWGYCPWLVLTGTYCPGCGGLRAVNDLTRGDVAGAASSNLLLVGLLPVLAGLWLRSVSDRWRGVTRRAVGGRRQLLLGAGFLVLALGFAMLRNSALPWLAP